MARKRRLKANLGCRTAKNVVTVVKVVSLKNIQLSLKSESSKRDSNFRN